ncbi:hypothetical protein [Chitinophaga tropicalis]|uniref:Outer membrane protein beta-barrel domain-containing protein n=1 Tax=Chitinophaga tropicalis TaxID=2683588 RepID=A0A7K1TZJ1_9BACT|nr:hypothetical protein [Chitinophaga tropicalis]MVT07460.1 hypothetical protein [Chitinophaga tropicalis]
MRTIILFATIFLATLEISFAQHFSHGAGAGFFVEDAGATDVKASFALTYSPRFNFAETENTSLSIGVPLSAGFSGSYSAGYSSSYGYYEDNNVGYMVNVPLLFSFNIGAGAVKGNRSRMGFFIGAGYAYHVGTADYTFTDEYGYDWKDSRSESTTGPAGNFGIRIAVGSRKRHNIEIRTSYMKGITNYKPDIFGMNCLFNF